jgi:hypothetical protein
MELFLGIPLGCFSWFEVHGGCMQPEEIVEQLQADVELFMKEIALIESSVREKRLVDIGCIAADADYAIYGMPQSMAQEAARLTEQVNDSVNKIEHAVEVNNFRDKLVRSLPTLIREKAKSVNKL